MIALRRTPRESPLPDITPLLDVVFILLIFFVLAAAFAVHGVDMRLPKSSSARAYAGKPFEVVLAADGSLRHGGQRITLRDLGFLVARNSNGEARTRPILLIPDRDASVGAFMETVNAIRDNGGDRLVIAAQPTPKATVR
jgi:biopolymer transport protein ExbD